MNPDESLLRALSAVPRVGSTVGVFLQMVSGLARVNLQGATVDLKCDGWNPPIPGQSVRVESVDGFMRVVGPAGARSVTGTVIASVDSGTRVRVTVDGAEQTLPVMAGYTPTAADSVVIDWQSGYVLGKQATARVDPVIPPTGGGVVEFTGLLVQSTDSGRFNTGGNTFGNSDVWTGTTTRGAWFYSGGFQALAGATITKAEIYLPLIQQQNNMSFALHAHPSKPGSDPGAISTFAHTGARGGWVSIGVGFGNALRDNPNFGITVLSPGGGLNKWVGRGTDGMSGAIRFAGSR